MRYAEQHAERASSSLQWMKLHADVLLFGVVLSHTRYISTYPSSPSPSFPVVPPPPPALYSPSQSARCSTAARSISSLVSSAVHHNASANRSASNLRKKPLWPHLQVLAFSVQLRGELFQFFQRSLRLFCRLLQQVVVYAPSILTICL